MEENQSGQEPWWKVAKEQKPEESFEETANDLSRFWTGGVEEASFREHRDLPTVKRGLDEIPLDRLARPYFLDDSGIFLRVVREIYEGANRSVYRFMRDRF